MKFWFLALTLMLASSIGWTQDAKKKSTLNTHLFEAEEATSLSGKVKVVREIQEETEVFLDAQKGNSGPFTLPTSIKNRAALLKILQKSQKPGGPSVTLTLDDQQRIKDVQENQSASSPSAFGP